MAVSFGSNAYYIRPTLQFVEADSLIPLPSVPALDVGFLAHLPPTYEKPSKP